MNAPHRRKTALGNRIQQEKKREIERERKKKDLSLVCGLLCLSGNVIAVTKREDRIKLFV